MNNHNNIQNLTALPNLNGAPNFERTVFSVVKLTGAHAGMVLLFLLVIISHGLQAVCCVIPPSGPAIRLSLSGLVSAANGQLQSLVLDILIKPLIEHQDTLERQCESTIGNYNTQLQIWTIDVRECKKRIQNKRSSGVDASEDIEALRQLNENPPEKPVAYKMLCNEFNVDTLFRNKINHKSLLLVSNGGSILAEGTLSFKHLLGKVVEAFSGSSDSSNKAYGNKFDPARIKLSSLITVTDDFLEATMEKANKNLILRYFYKTISFYVPETHENGPMENDGEAKQVLKAYYDQMVRYYQESYRLIKDPDYKIKEAELMPEAAEILGAFKEQVKDNSREGGFFYKILGVSRRAPEIVLKLCGIIHFFEGKQGDISAETINTAIGIYSFFLPYHVCVYEGPARTRRYAKIIDEALTEKYLAQNRRFFLYSGLTQDLSNKLFKSKSHNVRIAMNQLIMEQKVRIFTCGGRPCIDLKPYTGRPVHDAAQELFKYEGLTGEIQYEAPYVQHHILEMGTLSNGKNSMFFRADNIPPPAFTGLGKFIFAEGEVRQVNHFDQH